MSQLADATAIAPIVVPYSSEFVERIKAAFPKNKDLHVALDAGLPNVGAYLHGELMAVGNLLEFWMAEMTRYKGIG